MSLCMTLCCFGGGPGIEPGRPSMTLCSQKDYECTVCVIQGITVSPELNVPTRLGCKTQIKKENGMKLSNANELMNCHLLSTMQQLK